MGNELTVSPQESALSVKEVMAQVNLIQSIMREAMHSGEHYGTIPGCGDKKVLMKSGAEKLNLTFRMAPDPEIEVIDLGNGHREYRVKCIMRSILTGTILGAGVGSCSTMESKYRWRSKSGYKIVGDTIPENYRAQKEEYRKQGFGCKQIDGKWKWIKYTESERIENPDIADQYNTCLKLAKKRAMVDAVLTCTAASDIFTQDLDEEQTESDSDPVAHQTPAHTDPPKTPEKQSGPHPTASPVSPSKISDSGRSQMIDLMNEMGYDAKKQELAFQKAELVGEQAALDGLSDRYQEFLKGKNK